MNLLRATRSLLATVFLLALAPTATFAASYWVQAGGGRNCTHTNLQSAIDAAQGSWGEDTIYLVGSGPFTGPFSIFAGGITLVGGVPSCGATDSIEYATVEAPSGHRPLSILVADEKRITLRRLVITTSFGTLKDTDGGGIWFIGLDLSELVLDDSRVINNTTFHDGGGIFVGRGSLVLDGGSVVSSNSAFNGGGIAAVNGARVRINNGTVTANTAFFEGGGIYAPKAEVSTSISGSQSTISNNLAGQDGGGIYAGDRVSIGELAPCLISGNQARHGGGIYLNGASASLFHGDFRLNRASQKGGGIFVSSGSSLFTENSNPLADGYPAFSQNEGLQGAALYAEGSSEVLLLSGSIAHHDTAASGAAAVAASGPLGYYFFRGLTVFDNRAPEVFLAEGGAPLVLLHLTTHGNSLDRLIRWDGLAPGPRVANSVISDTAPILSDVPATRALPEIHCILSPSFLPLQGMPDGTDLSQFFLGDPRFVEPARGNLHVEATSPAVDLCPQALFETANAGYDRDLSVRGFDEPFRPNLAGRTHDAGADEVVPLVWDDFESGSFDHWQTTLLPSPQEGNNLRITAAARLGPPTSQRGLQFTFVDPSVQAPVDAFIWALPAIVPGNDRSRFNGSFALDPQGLTMSSTPGLNRLPLIVLSERFAKRRLAFDLLRSAADRWSFEVRYWPDDLSGPVVAGNAFFACAALPCGKPADWRQNRIELEWRGGTPAHLNVWRLRYVNGLPDPATRFLMFSLDLPMASTRVDDVLIGNLSEQSAGTFGTLFLDEVSFTR